MKTRDLLVASLFLIVGAIALFGYCQATAGLPYYFMWDMDLVVALDTLAVRSHWIPEQLHHPSFGMVFFLSLMEKIGAFVGALSITDFRSLAEALNPLAAIAEWTEYLRAFSPLIAFATAVTLWLAAALFTALTLPESLLLFAFFAAQSSLVYQSLMVRSELYSVFFWALALLSLVAGARTVRLPRKNAWLFISGAFAALSFLTKVQAFLYLIALLALIFLVSPLKPLARPTKKRLTIFSGLAVSNFTIYAALLVVALKTPIPPELATWTDSYQLSTFGISFLLFFAAVAAAQLSRFRWAANVQPFTGEIDSLTLIGAGFLAAFALHFAALTDPGRAATYLVYDFKVLFCRSFAPNTYTWGNLWTFVRFQPLPFLFNLVLVFAHLRFFTVKGAYAKKRASTLFIALSALVYLQTAFGTRGYLKDLLWVQVLLGVVNIFGLILWIDTLPSTHRFRKNILAAALAGLTLVAGADIAPMLHRTKAYYYDYGWNDRPFLSNIYGGSHLLYRDLMSDRYPPESPTREVARRSARRQARDRQAAASVFQNQRLNHQHLSVAAEGFPVFHDTLDLRITHVSDELREALVVDSSAAPRRTGIFYREDRLDPTLDALQKTKAAGDVQALAILERADLEVLLFLPTEAFVQLTSEPPKKSAPRIDLSNGARNLTFYGLPLGAYSLLKPAELQDRYFFVLRDR